ncbi:hypothetical protein GME43_21965, partial [Shigella sonnei]|nr:hypothetical protein [Shigella sonnei]
MARKTICFSRSVEI